MNRYKPKKKTFYVLFDLANGHYPKHYLWWFDRKIDAINKYKEHLNDPKYAKLSKPVKVKLCE